MEEGSSDFAPDKLKMIRQIGHGSEGPVFLVEVDSRRFVMKGNATVVDKDRVDVLRRLRHDNVVRYFRFENHMGRQISFLEYANGGDLNHFLIERQKSNRPLAQSEIQLLITQICSGLQYLHGRGIVHGDLQPTNILLHFQNGVPVMKLTDYAQNNKTQLMYAAPEVLQGATPCFESDVWSLGIIIFQMVTFQLPFLQPVGQAISTIALSSIADIRIKKIVRCALMRQPRDRITLTNIARNINRRSTLDVSEPQESFLSSVETASLALDTSYLDTSLLPLE